MKLWYQKQMSTDLLLLLLRQIYASPQLYPIVCLLLIAQPDLTRRTDFVNNYSALLQTSAYLFPETGTTPKVCFGVVKPRAVYEKCPTQHMADVQMLESREELPSVFKCPDGNPKSIWCVRVDGAGDEGPSHKEVAFLWTEKHLKQNHKLTCVTTRYSGGS